MHKRIYFSIPIWATLSITFGVLGLCMRWESVGDNTIVGLFINFLSSEISDYGNARTTWYVWACRLGILLLLSLVIIAGAMAISFFITLLIGLMMVGQRGRWGFSDKLGLYEIRVPFAVMVGLFACATFLMVAEVVIQRNPHSTMPIGFIPPIIIFCSAFFLVFLICKKKPKS